MQVYVATFSTRFKALLQYRAAALAGVGTQIFWGCIKLMVLGAFYAQATTQPPLSFYDVVVYVWLGQVLLAVLPWNNDPELESLFRSGAVVYELQRPVNLYAFWFARILAFRTAPTLLRLVPGLIFAMLLLPLIGLDEWQLHPPKDWVHGLLFLMSMLVTLALSCTITLFVATVMFWTIEGRGVSNMVTALVTVLSGMVVPLPLFPDWLQPFLHWQPFRGLCDVPYRIYSGNIEGSEALFEIGLQLGWFVFLLAGTYWLFHQARQKLVVQGG